MRFGTHQEYLASFPISSRTLLWVKGGTFLFIWSVLHIRSAYLLFIILTGLILPLLNVLLWKNKMVKSLSFRHHLLYIHFVVTHDGISALFKLKLTRLNQDVCPSLAEVRCEAQPAWKRSCSFGFHCASWRQSSWQSNRQSNEHRENGWLLMRSSQQLITAGNSGGEHVLH